MSQNPLIEILKANHLLRSSNEVVIFEQALAELAQNLTLLICQAYT